MDSLKKIIDLINIKQPIYELKAPNNASLPYLIIENIASSELSDRRINGTRSVAEIDAQIMINSSNFEQCKMIANHIFNILDGVINLDEIQSITAEMPIYNNYENISEFDQVIQGLVKFTYTI